MTTAELLHQAQRRLETLTPERLRVADDFLAYLEDRESTEATEELLAIPGLLAEIREAEDDQIEGRLTAVGELRRKY